MLFCLYWFSFVEWKLSYSSKEKKKKSCFGGFQSAVYLFDGLCMDFVALDLPPSLPKKWTIVWLHINLQFIVVEEKSSLTPNAY
jgi:hypothetical protein